MRAVSTAMLATAITFAAPTPASAWYFGGHYGHSYGYGHGYGYGYGHYSRHYGYGYHSPYYGYGGYGYGYAPHDYSYGYRGSTYSHDSASDDTSAPVTQDNGTYGTGSSAATATASVTASEDMGAGPGWDLLAAGNYPRALARFAREAASRPARGVPKAGYALAAAAGGNLERGVWAMRRAFRIDPDSVEYVTVGERLRPRVDALITRYQATLAGSEHNPDAAFMLASLHYLLGEREAARHSLERAVADGDHSASAANLQRLLGARTGHARDDGAEPGAEPNHRGSGPTRG